VAARRRHRWVLDIESDGSAITLVRLARHDGSPRRRSSTRRSAAARSPATRRGLGLVQPELCDRVGEDRRHAGRVAPDQRPLGPGRRLPPAARAEARCGRRARRPRRRRPRWRRRQPLGLGVAGGAGLGSAAGRRRPGHAGALLGAADADPGGSALWLRVESFRRFLAASEAHHADEAAKRGVLREYTAWAVALGELDGWSRSVAASATADDPDGVRFLRTAV
jgi:hypothetical protein